MIHKHHAVLTLLALAYAGVAGAQSAGEPATTSESSRSGALPFSRWSAQFEDLNPGTFEVGLFGQWTRFGEQGDIRLETRTRGGWGGRMGLALGTRFVVELDASTARLQDTAGARVTHSAVALRGNVTSLPEFARGRARAILGVGPVRHRFSGGGVSDTEWGISGLAGLRALITEPVAVRGDAVLDFLPSSGNVNLGIRLGLSWLFGTEVNGAGARGEATEPVAVPVARPPVTPTPPPVIEDESGLGAAALSPVEVDALREMIFFDYDRADIRPDAAAILNRKIPILLARPGFQVRIEGHADDRGSDEYNLALGQRRAAETRDYMIQRGVPAARLPIVSFGEEMKLCVQEPMTEACHQQNRRAEFRIMTGAQDGM